MMMMMMMRMRFWYFWQDIANVSQLARPSFFIVLMKTGQLLRTAGSRWMTPELDHCHYGTPINHGTSSYTSCVGVKTRLPTQEPWELAHKDKRDGLGIQDLTTDFSYFLVLTLTIHFCVSQVPDS